MLKKRVINFVLLISIVTPILFLTPLISAFAGGDGSLANPYQISNWTDLNATRLNLNANYSLITNISSLTIGYSGIGDNWDCIGSGNNFYGNFNGNNNTISDIIITSCSSLYSGFFGKTWGSNISNIGLINFTLNVSSSSAGAGGLIGSSFSGIISNSYSSGTITGEVGFGMDVGGLTGGGATVINSHSDVNMILNCTDLVGGSFVGGLVSSETTILNSYSTGNITTFGTGICIVGGLVGLETSNGVNNSYSTVKINGSAEGGNSFVGGLVGKISTGTIYNSYATGNVNGISIVGGLLGYIQLGGAILNSYATGNVTATGNNVGGLLGYNNNGEIDNSYSLGSVTGADNVGGLVGYNPYSVLINSYSTGKITGTGSNVGGLTGYAYLGVVNNSYWDNQTSEMTNSGSGFPRTTPQMKSISTFNLWNIASSLIDLNNGYPYLSWQNAISSFIWSIYVKPTPTPPYFTNIAKNMSHVDIGGNVNFSSQVSDDFTNVSSAWFVDDFDISYKETQSQNLSGQSEYIGSTKYDAQTMRFSNNGYLYSACVNLATYYLTSQGNVIVSIYNTGQTGNCGAYNVCPTTEITNLTIEAQNITSTMTTFCRNFTSPAKVYANVSYALLLKAPASSITYNYQIQDRYASAYSNGAELTSYDGGKTWTSWTYPISEYDTKFSVYLGTFESKNETPILVNKNSGNISFVKQLKFYRDTPFNWKFCANDSNNLTGCSNNQIISVLKSQDLIMPSAGIYSPPNNTYLNGVTLIDGWALDDIGVDYVSYQYKNLTIPDWTNITGCDKITSPFICNWNTTAYSDDNYGYDIKIVPCDTSGNCNISTSPRHYFIDRKRPIDQITKSYPAGQSSIRNSQSIILKLNVTDGSGSGMNLTANSIDLTLMNGSGNSSMALESGTGSANTYSIFNLTTIISSITGLFQIPYYAYDLALPANMLFNTFNLQIDNSPPTYNLSGLHQSDLYFLHHHKR